MDIFRTIIFLCIYSAGVYGSVIKLQDIDCQLLGSKNDKIVMRPGTLAKSTCIKIENKVSCSYTDLAGNKLGDPTDFISYMDDKTFTFELWISSLGNIMMFFNYPENRYHMGMTIINPKYPQVINKQCLGEILK